MDVRDWLERYGYAANYPGEWIVLSGPTTTEESGPTSHTLEFNGRRKEDAMEVIQRMRTTEPQLWTVAIKVPITPEQRFAGDRLVPNLAKNKPSMLPNSNTEQHDTRDC
ncbi:MAG TPA: hypothetical protein VLV31_13190 [Candidatus Acidoferrales bacterium]|nr:hypothetical protein [Candidatus Acidoferrales bacterium]